MFKHYSSSDRRSRPRRGFTLVETLVATFGASAILGSVLVTGNAVVNTMAAIVNYNDLNSHSRNTLDIMSRDLRNTATVTSLDNNQVTVSNTVTGDLISYQWDGTNYFTRTVNGSRTVMLTGCDTLTFNGYQRNPTDNFQFVPAHTIAETKLISVSWRCSRQILGAKLNTESVQTAQICIRN
jgi:type II secretory pathway component PulJ